MPYWNRDKPEEPFMTWCDDCFPVELPPFFAIRGFPGIDSYLDSTFGGTEHRREVERDDPARVDHARIVGEHRMTPDGYAWAPWTMGAPCESCGKAL